MKGTVQVLICDSTPDSQGNLFRAEGVALPTEEVPVILEFQLGYLAAYVGRAKLRMNAGVIYADMELLARMGENSALHTLYPIPVFSVTERHGQVIHNTGVKYIGLSISRHADHRINTVGQQGLKP